MLAGAKLKCIIPGGISTKVLTAAEIEPVTYDHASFSAAGSSLGSGGMIVIAEGTCMVRLLQVMLRFYHHESCGQCTPCREGMGWMHRIIDRIVAGNGRPEDIEQLYQISRWNDGNTICGMGDAAGYAAIGILDKYRDEFEHCITHEALAFRRQPRGPRECLRSSSTGNPVQAADNQSVLEAARASGHYIPYFCWHPKLSVAGNCRICVVQVEGRSWVEIACNMPVTEGLRVFTDSDLVKAHRKMVMQFLTLNHPVDCGICDKAGECTLQDYHYAYNGAPSISREPKVRSTKYHDLSAAHRARQRALHPVLALRALHPRDLEVLRARHQAPRRRIAGPRQRGRRARPRPVLGQRHRHLPGRRAAVAAVPPQGPGLVPEADALGVPRLRARLHRADLAPEARVAAEGARPEAERPHRSRHAAREPGGQRPVDLQQGTRPRADSRAARAPRSRCSRASRSSWPRRSTPPAGCSAQRSARWRWCPPGARTRSSRRSRARSPRASTPSSRKTPRPRRASASTTTC